MLCRRRDIHSARWLCLRCATADGRAVELGIRPEHVEAGGDLPAVIEMVEPMGSDQLAWLRLGDHPLSMRLPAEAADRRRRIDPAAASGRQTQSIRRRFRAPTVIFQSTRNPMTPLDGLSFQLYSARTLEPLEAQFELLAGLGYKKVEPFGGLSAIRKSSKASWNGTACRRHRRMSASTGCAPIPSQRCRMCRDLGIQTIYAPAPPPGERDGGEAEWTALGRELDRDWKDRHRRGPEVRLA